jgi:hypothetical protein
VRLEVGPEYVRVKLGILVLFYSTNKHCAGWFLNTRCTTARQTCRIHMLPRTMCGTFHSGIMTVSVLSLPDMLPITDDLVQGPRATLVASQG